MKWVEIGLGLVGLLTAVACSGNPPASPDADPAATVSTIPTSNLPPTAPPTPTATPAPFTDLLIEPSQVTLEPTEQLQLHAIALDSNGNVIPNAFVTWSSSDAGAVDSSGVFIAGEAAGLYEEAVSVQVSARGRVEQASVDVKINAGPVDRVTVGSPQSELFTGDSAPLFAEPADRFGYVVTANVTW